MKKILLVFAHPDDEAFACGGLIPKYVAAGWEVHLVCATRGEAGNRGLHGDISDDALGAIRAKELEEAGAILGLSTITFLGYPDGTLARLPPGEVEDKVFREMVRIVPHVVITYEPRGISNHPDHIKLTTATTVAFQRYVQDVADPPRTPKLYFACLPASVARYLTRQKVLPAESFGKPWSTTPDKLITTVIDIERYRRKKIQALKSHRSQKQDVDRFLSLTSNPLISNEYFILRMSGYTEVYMGKTDRVSNRL